MAWRKYCTRNIKYEKYNDVYGHPVNRIDTGYAAVYQKFEKGRLNIKKYEGCQGQDTINAADAVTGIAMIKYTYPRLFAAML